MKRADLFANAIKRLEYEESVGHEFGLNDDEFCALRSTLRCLERECWNMTMAAHPRIVALGLALAITKRKFPEQGTKP